MMNGDPNESEASYLERPYSPFMGNNPVRAIYEAGTTERAAELRANRPTPEQREQRNMTDMVEEYGEYALQWAYWLGSSAVGQVQQMLNRGEEDE